MPATRSSRPRDGGYPCADPPPSSRRPKAARSSCSSTWRRRTRLRGRRRVAAAWAAYKPDAKWPLKVTTPVADKDGWTDRKSYSYQTSPNEKRDVGADVRRANDTWTVAIYDMAQAVGEKRAAQVGLIYGKLLPKGRTPRVVRRQEGEPARRRAPGAELRKFVEDVDEAHRRAGRLARPLPGRPRRARRGLRRARARQARRRWTRTPGT